MAEGEESNEGSGDVNEPFEGEDTEVQHVLKKKSLAQILICILREGTWFGFKCFFSSALDLQS